MTDLPFFLVRALYVEFGVGATLGNGHMLSGVGTDSDIVDEEAFWGVTSAEDEGMARF